jgi:hypothetical protein
MKTDKEKIFYSVCKFILCHGEIPEDLFLKRVARLNIIIIFFGIIDNIKLERLS